MKTVSKRFPANTSLLESTFLNDKKVDGELYGLLQSYAFPNGQKETIIEKKELPAQTVLCSKLNIKSPKTYRAHLQYLISKGFVEDRGDKLYLPNVEEIYFMIPLSTLMFLNDTAKEQVIKVYIYLGQRYKYKKDYIFTIAEIASHIGIELNNNQRNYITINNVLTCLQNHGLISYKEIYENNLPKKQLTSFSFEVKNLEVK